MGRMWNRFQRDGVIGAIDNLNRHRGGSLADNRALGKSSNAGAVSKSDKGSQDPVLVDCSRWHQNVPMVWPP
jgi:hypothetical protein